MQQVRDLKARVVGKHVYANLYGCDPALMSDRKRLVEIVRRAAELSNATLVEVLSWKFGGEKGGISVIALVNESHIALHTWREYNYATVDIYTCGEHTDPEKGLEYVISELKPRETLKHKIDRSLA